MRKKRRRRRGRKKGKEGRNGWMDETLLPFFKPDAIPENLDLPRPASAHFSGARFARPRHLGHFDPPSSVSRSRRRRASVSHRHARMIKKKGKETKRREEKKRKEKRGGEEEKRNVKRKEKQGRTSSYRPVFSHAMQHFALPFVTRFFTQFIALRPALVCLSASSCRVFPSTRSRGPAV